MIEIPVLTIIVPCFNEEDVVKSSYFELSSILQKLIENKKVSPESYICFVDDGSKDKTWNIIKKISKYNDVKGLKLSKNFGHQYALLAGLMENESDIFITIDVDLQDDINVIPNMVDKYLEGYEIVFGVRKNRDSDNFVKRITAQCYYKLLNLLGVTSIYNHADFRLVSKNVVDALSKTTETNLYLRGLIANLGFNSCEIYYNRGKRKLGTPKYNFYSSFKLAMQGITSFSIKPLHFITFLGIFCFLFAIGMSFVAIYEYLISNIVRGWTSLFISIYFLGGIQLIAIGVIGEYIGKIYLETKKRPRYVIEQKVD